MGECVLGSPHITCYYCNQIGSCGQHVATDVLTAVEAANGLD
ncbi:hypothetical protein NJ7G_1240 [Natrinema sp. J7-2]|nr:hypothetical protein NJ7G_1240 [Natrinema sp. J7-2]